jgi:Effector-associated domain 11/CHAT domain
MDATTKAKIQQLVGAAKLDKALDEWGIWAETHGDEDTKTQIIMLKGQFSSVRREENQGLLSRGEAQMAKNRIANAVLTSLSDLSDDDAPKTTVATTTTSKTPPSVISTPTSNVVLFLAANPTDAARLQLEEEYGEVEDILQSSGYDLKRKRAVKVEELQESIFDFRPSIIHFSGHGIGKMVNGKRGIGLDEDDAKEITTGLILEDNNKRKVLVKTEALARMFASFKRQGIDIQVIVLNACYSAGQADALLPYCRFMIGMTDAVGDEDAKAFAKAFYKWMVKLKGDVFNAFDNAKVYLELKDYGDKDLPKLYENKG